MRALTTVTEGAVIAIELAEEVDAVESLWTSRTFAPLMLAVSKVERAAGTATAVNVATIVTDAPGASTPPEPRGATLPHVTLLAVVLLSAVLAPAYARYVELNVSTSGTVVRVVSPLLVTVRSKPTCSPDLDRRVLTGVARLAHRHAAAA